MIYNTNDWIHIEDDDTQEQMICYYLDKKNKKIIGISNATKDQLELYKNFTR